MRNGGTDVKPDPQSHIRIVSFGGTLKVMMSLRRPKRLTIHGHDEKEYFFLIKVTAAGNCACHLDASVLRSGPWSCRDGWQRLRTDPGCWGFASRLQFDQRVSQSLLGVFHQRVACMLRCSGR